MDFSKKNLRKLAALMREEGLTSLKLSEEGNAISLKMEKTPQPMPISAQISELPVATEFDFGNANEVTAPMVGVFYAAPSPDSEPFVKVGDRVRRGQVLCIVEAMKLMNEITADFDGEVMDICAVDGELVEYGQCLVRLSKEGER